MAKKRKRNMCLICNEKYGIYYGDVISFNTVTRVVKVRECRHVARWYGRTGGITSLARYGLCGPNASQSRIGGAVDGVSILTGIVNVFSVSKEAAKTFEGSKPSE